MFVNYVGHVNFFLFFFYDNDLWHLPLLARSKSLHNRSPPIDSSFSDNFEDPESSPIDSPFSNNEEDISVPFVSRNCSSLNDRCVILACNT